MTALVFIIGGCESLSCRNSIIYKHYQYFRILELNQYIVNPQTDLCEDILAIIRSL